MIRYLVRRDPYTPLLLNNLVAGSLMAGAVTVFTREENGIVIGSIQLPLALLITFIALSGLARTETTKQRFDEVWLTSPVSSKSLSRVRFLMFLGACLIPMFLGWLALRLNQPDAASFPVATLMLGSAGAIGLAIAVHNQRSHGINLLGKGVWLPALATLVIGFGLVIATSAPWFSIGIVGLAAIASIFSWITTPDWIDGNTPKSASKTPETTSRKLWTARSPFSPETSLLLRSTFGNPVWSIFALSWAFMASIMLTMSSAGVAFLPILALNLHKLNQASNCVLRSIGHLPVNRWKLAPLVVLSPLWIVILFTLFMSTIRGATASTGYPFWVGIGHERFQVDGETAFRSKLQVPSNLWKLHFGSQPLSIDLPDQDGHPSESMELTMHRPLSFLPIAVYNPYETRASSSLEFSATQLSRLVMDGMGVDLPLEEVMEKYLEVRNGYVNTKSDHGPEAPVSFFERFRGTPLLAQPGSANAAPLLILLMWTCVSILSFRKRQYPQDSKRMSFWIVVSTILFAVSVYGIKFGAEQGPEFNRAVLQWIGTALPENPLYASLGWLLLASLPALYFMKMFVTMDTPAKSALKLSWSRKS